MSGVRISGEDQRLIEQAGQLAAAGEARQAIERYRSVLQRHPAVPELWYNLARAERAAGEFAAALVSYERAISLGLHSPEEAHLNRAVILTDDLRRDEDAEDELKRALSLNPDYLPAWLNLANLQEDLGRRAR